VPPRAAGRDSRRGVVRRSWYRLEWRELFAYALPGCLSGLQAAAFITWWLILWKVPAARVPFAAGNDAARLLAFWLPDLGVSCSTSLAAAWLLNAGSRWGILLAWFAAGGVVYAAAYCVASTTMTGSGWWGAVLMALAALLSAVAALDASAPLIEIFRHARPASPGHNVVKTLLQIVLFWSFFLAVIPLAIRFVELQAGLAGFDLPARRWLAAALFLGFSSLGLASGLTMARLGDGTPLPLDATNRLVVRGPYAYLRNPMVTAGMGQGVAVSLLLGSYGVLVYVLLGGLIWQGLVRPAEEADLAATFGAPYLEYREAVRCWWPRRRPYS
jgi:protein-S-isoprenylcysteine O-methyltransferase Ste14